MFDLKTVTQRALARQCEKDYPFHHLQMKGIDVVCRRCGLQGAELFVAFTRQRQVQAKEKKVVKCVSI